MAGLLFVAVTVAVRVVEDRTVLRWRGNRPRMAVRGIRLERRKSRVPWIYLVYHAPRRSVVALAAEERGHVER